MGDTDMDENQAMVIAGQVAVEVSKEVYGDLAKPSVVQAGQIFETIFGLFNNVFLYPVKLANTQFKYKLQAFSEELANKIKDIPSENIVQPPLYIAGPTLEALKYTYDTKELKEMYLNLLSSSMNSEKSKLVHPGYVDIIKQMSPLDAKLFKYLSTLSNDDKYIACAEIIILTGNANDEYFVNAIPTNFINFNIDDNDYFALSSCLVNLQRLGLIVITEFITVTDETKYNDLLNHEFIISKLEEYKSLPNGTNYSVKIRFRRSITTTDFGISFSEICM